jgi:sterol desaturase/sphingolipid hydroxylase (fatty acid hydroxylase superfamily)
MLIQNEAIIRLFFFSGIFILMAIYEYLAPKRQLTVPKSKRWVNNLAIVLIDTVIIRVIFPMAAVGIAFYAQTHRIGLFNTLDLNFYFVVVLSVVILDLAIYLQHVMFHYVPIFWRIHRMHHIDLDIDVTTGIRFHPFEILLSLLIKFGVILVIGAPGIAVLIFEILLNATSMFNHGNVRIPFKLDQLIRKIIVTPDMHRVHHSDIPTETNSNFGFNFSCWDKIFKTYTAQPKLGHEKMVIGLKWMRDFKYCINLLGMLWVPFLKDKSNQ